MADVGEVRYKAKVDDSGVDQDIAQTEKKIEESSKSVQSKIDQAAKKTSESVGNAVKEIGENASNAKSETTKFSDAISGIKDSSVEELNDTLEKTKSSLNDVASAGESASKKLSIGSAASSAFSKLGSAAKTAGSVGLTAVKGIGTAFVGLTSAAAAGVTAVAKVGIEYNAQMQIYQTAFTTMLGDAEKAQALTDNLKTLAAKTPLAMTDLADASQILLAFGSSAEELPDQLKRLGDVSQGNAEKLGTMATAFGRIQSNGYASLEEINMMIDQGFNPLNIIAEQTGETMAEVRQRVSDGEVSFEELSEALRIATDEGGQFYNAMENQSKTFEGQMSTLQDNVSALAGSLTEDLFGKLSESALPQVNAWVDELLTAAETNGVAGAVDTAGTVLTKALTAILDAAPSFIEAATSLVGSFLEAVSKSGPEITDGAVQVILTMAEGFVSMVPQIMSTATTLIAGFINSLANNMPQIISMAGKLIMSLASGMVQNAPKIISAVGNLVTSIIKAFSQVNWLQVGKDVIRGVINGIGAMAGALWDAAVNVAKSALNGIKSFFGIASPSKVMRDQVGKQIDAGIGVGLKEGIPEIDKGASMVSRRLLGSFSADVDYNLPDLRETAKSLSASISSTSVGGARIEVPVSIDGREVARATAWYMGEQLAWEER